MRVCLADFQKEPDIVNVDFEFFDPQEQDFDGFRALLRQLFDSDANLVNLSGLVDLILAQNKVGSTVKSDGNESHLFAFLTVLNLQEHQVSYVLFGCTILTGMATNLRYSQSKPAIASLIAYLQQKAAEANLEPIRQQLSQVPVPNIGLVLSERMVNAPTELVPPMYKMLLEEIEWALADQEPYNFSHYLIVSRTYEAIMSNLQHEDGRSQKKKKKDTSGEKEIYYFHPEDELLHKYAMSKGNFQFTHQQVEGHSDSKRAFHDFGIKTGGHLMLIEASKLHAAVEEMASAIQPAQ